MNHDKLGDSISPKWKLNNWDKFIQSYKDFQDLYQNKPLSVQCSTVATFTKKRCPNPSIKNIEGFEMCQSCYDYWMAKVKDVEKQRQKQNGDFYQYEFDQL